MKFLNINNEEILDKEPNKDILENEIGENQKYFFYNQKEIEEEEELLGLINIKNEKEIKELDIISKDMKGFFKDI